jgi:hypothetical protein
MFRVLFEPDHPLGLEGPQNAKNISFIANFIFAIYIMLPNKQTMQLYIWA